MNNEGWAPLANMNFYLKDPISCMAGMRSFQQYSGQCWSDATSIFMLYSFGLGPIFQKAFQRLTKEALEKEFIDWAGTPESKKFIYSIIFKEQPAAAAELGDLIDRVYTQLINALAQYLVCLQRRFLNSIKPQETLTPKAQTCSPKIYSFCKEEAGRYIGAYMNPVIFKSRGELAFYNTLAPFNTTAAKRWRQNLFRRPNLQSNQIQSFLEEGQRGGLPSLFSKCIPVYMKFFNSSPQMLFAINVLNQPDRLEATVAPFGNSFILFSDVLQTRTAEGIPFIIQSQFQSICKLIGLNHKISLIVTVTRYDEPKGHVISLLECDNGQTVLYDDELREMVGIPWKDMFEIVNEEIPEMMYISIENISSRDAATLRQAITIEMAPLLEAPLVDFYVRLFLMNPIFLTIYKKSRRITVFKKDGSIETLAIPPGDFEFQIFTISNLINVFCYKVSAFAACVFQPPQVGGSKMALRRARQTRRQGRRRRSLGRRR
jgi:hypothetical protein